MQGLLDKIMSLPPAIVPFLLPSIEKVFLLTSSTYRVIIIANRIALAIIIKYSGNNWREV